MPDNNGLQQSMADIIDALNAMARENGFPEVDPTPLPAASASKPGLYITYEGDESPPPPDLNWLIPIGTAAQFDLYVYFTVEDGLTLVQTAINKRQLVADTLRALNAKDPAVANFRCFIRRCIPMYDWATRAWGGLLIQVVVDSFRNSSDG